MEFLLLFLLFLFTLILLSLLFYKITMKNKKLFLMSWLLIVWMIVLTQSSLSFASSSVWWDISEYRKTVTEEMKSKMEQYRKTTKTQLESMLKDVWNKIKEEIFEDLDDDYLEEIKDLQEKYREKEEEIREAYEDVSDPSLLKEALMSLIENKTAEIKEILPEDKAELYQELKDELEQKREEKKEMDMEKKSEMIQERFSKTTQMIIGKVDTSFEKFEKKQDGDIEKITPFYDRFTIIVESAITKIENNEKFSEEDKLARIDMMEGILFAIEERKAALLENDSYIEDELNDIIDSIVE